MFKTSRGFTLIELAIVLTIMGLLVLPLLNTYAQIAASRRRIDTGEHIHQIRLAMAQYFYRNNKYPCPAPAVQPDDPYAFDQDCFIRTPIDITKAARRGIFAHGDTDNTLVIEGAVPYRLLNISRETARDGWGNLYTYAVSANMTSPDTEAGGGVIGVKDEKDRSMITPENSVLWAVVSHGPDGSGAYNGSTSPNKCIQNHMDSANCGHSGQFRIAPYSTTLGKNYFDDMVHYQAWAEVPDGVQASSCNIPGNDDIASTIVQDGAVVNICGEQAKRYTGKLDCKFYDMS